MTRTLLSTSSDGEPEDADTDRKLVDEWKGNDRNMLRTTASLCHFSRVAYLDKSSLVLYSCPGSLTWSSCPPLDTLLEYVRDEERTSALGTRTQTPESRST